MKLTREQMWWIAEGLAVLMGSNEKRELIQEIVYDELKGDPTADHFPRRLAELMDHPPGWLTDWIASK